MCPGCPQHAGGRRTAPRFAFPSRNPQPQHAPFRGRAGAWRCREAQVQSLLLFCCKEYPGGAVRLELWLTGVQEVEKLLHHATDIVPVHQSKAQLHRSPGKGQSTGPPSAWPGSPHTTACPTRRKHNPHASPWGFRRALSAAGVSPLRQALCRWITLRSHPATALAPFGPPGCPPPMLLQCRSGRDRLALWCPGMQFQRVARHKDQLEARAGSGSGRPTAAVPPPRTSLDMLKVCAWALAGAILQFPQVQNGFWLNPANPNALHTPGPTMPHVYVTPHRKMPRDTPSAATVPEAARGVCPPMQPLTPLLHKQLPTCDQTSTLFSMSVLFCACARAHRMAPSPRGSSCFLVGGWAVWRCALHTQNLSDSPSTQGIGGRPWSPPSVCATQEGGEGEAVKHPGALKEDCAGEQSARGLQSPVLVQCHPGGHCRGQACAQEHLGHLRQEQTSCASAAIPASLQGAGCVGVSRSCPGQLCSPLDGHIQVLQAVHDGAPVALHSVVVGLHSLQQGRQSNVSVRRRLPC